MIWLYRFISGFLEVEFSGDISEVILNICAKNGITLWYSRRRGKNIRCRMFIRDFKLLPALTKKSGIRVHIIKRYGLPFIIKRYRKRWGIPAGAAIIFCFLKIMSLFIWTVEVEGNKAVPTEDILAACKGIGIYEGLPKSRLNPKNAKQQLLLETDRLAWASFNLEGSRLTVNVTESEDKKEDNGIPTNLKAAADGKITKINIKSGNCVVKVGDTVCKGDLLVSGVMETQSGMRFVHSTGSITAVTEREITVTANYKRTVSEKTGKLKKRSVLEIFGMRIPLYLGRQAGSYESVTKVKEASLFGKKLPIRLYTKYFEITRERQVEITENELKKELEELLKRRAAVENLGDFEVKNREFDEISGGISLKSLVLAEQDIAVPEELLFSAGN